MKVRRPYAFCCIEGGGRVSGCMCSNPDHGFAIVDVKAMLPGDEPVHTHSGEAIGALVAWARSQQAFPDNAAGGAGRGHIDENHRFTLRDMVAAIDAAPPVEGLTSGEGEPCDFYLGDCTRCGKRADRDNQLEPCARLRQSASPKATATASVREDFLSQLRRVNTERYQAWVGEGEDAGILFDAAELGGEVGELLNVVKKLEREARGWRGSRAAPDDFADECADVLICLDKLARRYAVDLAAATVAKFNATSDKVGLPHKLAALTDSGTAASIGGERA